MKRHLLFRYEDGKYTIAENDQIVFSIDGSSLRFVALDFYTGVYAGENKSVAIELINEITSDPLKKGSYIYTWLYDIIKSIRNEISGTEEDLVDDNETDSSSSKVIQLYEWAACAGDGFYFGQEGVPATEYPVHNMEADYAVRISGKSMKPTIEDGSIVLVKCVSELFDGDIGIFYVDGNIMCKRYSESSERVLLMPDNTSDHYDSIEITEDIECIIQGKVLE